MDDANMNCGAADEKLSSAISGAFADIARNVTQYRAGATWRRHRDAAGAGHTPVLPCSPSFGDQSLMSLSDTAQHPAIFARIRTGWRPSTSMAPRRDDAQNAFRPRRAESHAW